jgi:hypothetical protein
MREPHVPVGLFQKVGECLYRYSSNGVYYARIKSSGKEIRRSLETTDPALARRNLRKLRNEQNQIDRWCAWRSAQIDLVSETATVQPSWFLLANAL